MMRRKTRLLLEGIAARGDLDIERHGDGSPYARPTHRSAEIQAAVSEYMLAKLLLRIENGEEEETDARD